MGQNAKHDFLSLCQPAEANEIGELVRQSAASGHAIYPAGGQTQWDLAPPPAKAGILLDTRRLDHVIDYPARDMTITVQAGMTVAQLQAVLAGEKQRLPIDVPQAERATVGGALATNVSGPRRYGYGTLRDYIIGISVVNDQGREIKAGGRVVKNVAGYDLCKLFVGSLGTLGIITQATFKVRPCPAEHGLLAFSCPPDELEVVLAQLHASKTRPCAIELLNPGAATRLDAWPSEWTIVVGFEDNAEALKWQVGQLIREVGGRYSVNGKLGTCADAIWHVLVEFAGMSGGLLSFKAGVPPAQIATFCMQADQMLQPVQLQAQAGNGIVVGQCHGADVAAKIHEVRALAMAAGGHLVVTRCPTEWKNAEMV